MGDRGQIKIGKIYLYSHWAGSELKDVLKRAIARKQRWTDEEYLARIIFSEMIKDDVLGETGYGISTIEHGDNEHDILEVDVGKQVIREGKKKWTFEKFVEQELIEREI